MVRFHVFGFFAIAVCLAACLCVSADDDESEQEKAQKAVQAVADLAQTVLDSAKANFKEANSILTRVQSNKRSAEDATSQVNNLPNDHANAAGIADEVKKTSAQIIALYAAAHKAADLAFKSMQNMVNKANALVNEANIDTELESDSSSDYTQINNNIAEVKAKVASLQSEKTEQEKLLPPASALELEMSGLVDKVKVGKYHFSVTLSVSKIDNVLKKADVDIDKTEKKRDEVNNTLEEMMEVSQRAPQKLSVYVNTVIQNAANALVTASKAVDTAKKVKRDMMEIKAKAEASLANFKGEKNPDNVKDEVRNVRLFAEEVVNKAPEIASALQSAEITAINAESRKQSLIRVILSGDTQLSSEEDKITSKPDGPLRDGDKTLVNKEELPLSITNTESNTQGIVQTVSKSNTQLNGEVTKEQEQTLNRETDTTQNVLKVSPTLSDDKKTVIGTSENPMQQASEKLTVDEREQLKVTNSHILKDKLQTATKNGTNILPVNGNHSDFGVLGDNSMTVYVPLLAALIASAVLH